MIHSSDDLGVPPPPTIGDYHVRVRASNQKGRRAGARLCATGCRCEEDQSLGALSSRSPVAPRITSSTVAASSASAATEAFPPVSNLAPISKSAAKRAAKAERAVRFNEDIEDHMRAMSLGAPSSPPTAETAPELQHRTSLGNAPFCPGTGRNPCKWGRVKTWRFSRRRDSRFQVLHQPESPALT